MEVWITLRREYLDEIVITLKKRLIDYEQKDISDWDEMNRTHMQETIQQIKDKIKHCEEEIFIIDNWK